MDSNNSGEDVNLAATSANCSGGDIASHYYGQFLKHTGGDIPQPHISNTVPSPTSENLSESDFSLGGYPGPWGNYIGTFGFPVDTLSNTEELTPQQLAELDEYLNALSQQDSSIPACSNSESYPLQNSTQNCGIEELNIDFSNSGRQIYTEALNQWSAGYSGISDNIQYAESTYNPFGLTNSVFQNDCSASDTYVPETQPVFPETKSLRPSFADVAKNNPVLSHDGQQKSFQHGKVPNKKENKGFPDRKPGNVGHGFVNPHKGQSRKAKSFKSGNLQRSKSVPVEPAEIEPNSRYGLDTFDERYLTREASIKMTTMSCGNSRKNSTSSMSSGVSGMEEIHLSDKQTCNSKHSSDCDPFGANIKTEMDTKTSSNNNNERKSSNKKTDGCDQKGKTNGTQVRDQIYFDPRKIFQDSREKNSKSVQTNNEDYVPNNKQKLQPDKESLLTKEKTKASVKSGSTKYINNDLRDNKKHVNIEQDRGINSQGHNGKDSRQKSNVGNQGKNRARVSRSETIAQNKNGIKGNSRKDKEDKTKYIIGDWLLIAYDWTLWGGRKLLNFMWNILKLVLSVILLLLALLAHYTIIFCAKLWSFIQAKVPYFRKQREQNGYDWSSPMSQSRPKQFGLKENIMLPTTGNEAMKRLLSCKGKDPYSILGVRTDASDDDIKKYYRKQAVLVHPDKNKQPGAEEAFKILGHAFDLIGTVEKRQEYDAHLEMKDAETAMQEFADLLTKLHDKMQEASNLLRCDHCGGKHKRVPTDRPMYSARFCDRCNTRHAVKEGDVWAESKMLGFLWHYYACMEGRVFDITEWASCKHDNFKSMQANAHQVIYRLSTGGGRAKPNTSRTGEPNLEDFLNNLFSAATNLGEGSSSPNGTTGGGTGGPAGGGGGSGPSPTGTTKSTKAGKKKKRKH